LLLIALGFGAYPIQSLRAQTAGVRISGFERERATHVGRATGSDLTIAPHPQIAAVDSGEKGTASSGLSMQRALASTSKIGRAHV